MSRAKSRHQGDLAEDMVLDKTHSEVMKYSFTRQNRRVKRKKTNKKIAGDVTLRMNEMKKQLDRSNEEESRSKFIGRLKLMVNAPVEGQRKNNNNNNN